MRNQNGYGSITKLGGERSKPYAVRVSEMVSEGTLISKEEINRCSRQISVLDDESVMDVIRTLHPDDYIEWLQGILTDELKKQSYKGKQKQKYIGYYATRKEAQIALAEWNKQELKVDALEYTFADIYRLVQRDMDFDSMPQNTRASYDAGYKKCASLYSKQIAKLKLDDLQGVIDEYAGMSKASITNIMKTIRAVFEFAVRRELVGKDYSQYLRYPSSVSDKKERNVFTHEEIECLRLANTDIAKYTLMMIYLGCRIDEFVGIRKEDIHNGVVWIEGSKNSTSKRYVAIHPDIQDLMNEYMPCSYDSAQRLRKAFKKANPGHTPHDTRHTFATYASVCMDRTLREYQLGHRLAGMDDVYVHPEMLIPQIKEAISHLSM